ncbi:growth hormone secretagogue receptor type 1-like isoform X3 [Hemicordylus capensis]|uniref:growth hormone secretagogue receptor type 1-like isoform X3 n=1 Tax=Hemicordylus capensis TaxID=884348 RepID=UPI002302AA00|nr:growth hormone secretagogue receptor type 1-like isoform X3 [Hemicordylus capensis]
MLATTYILNFLKTKCLQSALSSLGIRPASISSPRPGPASLLLLQPPGIEETSFQVDSNNTFRFKEHRNGSLAEETTECTCLDRAARSGLLETMTWLSTLYFFLPVFCLVLLYGLICRKLWRTAHRLEGRQAATREKYHQQTVKMLAVVVLAFILCWLPLHVGRILFAQGNMVLYEVSQYFNLVSMLLFYLGASVNPILYNIMSQKYRVSSEGRLAS